MQSIPGQFTSYGAFFANMWEAVSNATALEFGLLVALPLLALLLGVRANRYIDTHPQTTLGIAAIDFMAPLLSPLLTIAFYSAAIGALKANDVETLLLPFALKLAVSWFAIQLVGLLSSKRIGSLFIALVIIPITLLHLFGLWGATREALTHVEFDIGSAHFNLYLVLKGILAIVALQWLASATVRVTDSRLRRVRNLRASNRTLILKMIQIASYCFIFLFGLQLAGISLTALSVFGGALGVGLGFGLQKIASNFISGIILLSEKSIEVDDVIELADGTTGVVKQTRARYTLLEMQDGKELLIPNEDFINQRVMSWTHSHKKGRVEITVHISYDSDVEEARRIMLEAARVHPKRLRSIEPMCVLHNFNDHGLELRLLFWIMDMTEGRMEPRSEVMLAILHGFKAQGIRIPFPQREMHIINESEKLA